MDSQLETSSFMFSVYFSIWYTFGKSSAYCHYFSVFWKGQSLLSFWPLVWIEHPNLNPHSQVTWKTDDLTVMKIINKKPTVISRIMFSYRPKQCKLDNHLIYMFMYSHPVSGNWKVSFDQTVNNFEAILSPVFLSLCLCFDFMATMFLVLWGRVTSRKLMVCCLFQRYLANKSYKDLFFISINIIYTITYFLSVLNNICFLKV